MLAVGDLHFKAGNQDETDRMEIEVLRILREHNFRSVVFLGDTLDRHEVVNSIVFHRATEFFFKVHEVVDQLIILIGNHDLKNNKEYFSEEHAFTPFKLWTKTWIVDKAMMIETPIGPCTFVPYVPPGRFMEALNTLMPKNLDDLEGRNVNETSDGRDDNLDKTSDKTSDETSDSGKNLDGDTSDGDVGNSRESWRSSTLIFAHQEFRGCKLGSIISESGDVWSEEYPVVISGHIHDLQTLPGVVYPGTPIQHSWSDSSDRYVLGITDRVTYIQVHGIKKRIVPIKFENLCKLKLEDFSGDWKTKVKVQVREEVSEKVMKDPLVQVLIKSGIKVSVEIISTEKTIVNPGKFREVLYKNLREKNLECVFSDFCRRSGVDI